MPRSPPKPTTPSPAPSHCTGPDCDLPVYSRKLCRGHYAQSARDPERPLRPLRDPEAAPLVRVSLRVSETAAAFVREDADGARQALESAASARALR